MRELPHGIAAIGLEAGPLSQWLHKGLAAYNLVLLPKLLAEAPPRHGKSNVPDRQRAHPRSRFTQAERRGSTIASDM